MARNYLICFAAGAALLAAAELSAQPRSFFAGNGTLHLMIRNGQVFTWGRSSSMTLGSGPGKTKAELPEPLSIRNARSAAVGESHALVLLQDGTIAGWGSNSECEVGNGIAGRTLKRWERLEPAFAPAAVTGLRNVVQVAAASHISGAVTRDGSVWLWGTGNNGLLADGNMEPRGANVACAPVPRKLEGLANVAMLALGDSHAVALTEEGTVFTWGINGYGELGDGTRENRSRPVRVQGIEHAVSVGAGNIMSSALLSDGTVLTWGGNINGQLGDPVTNPEPDERRFRTRPFKVPGVSGVERLHQGPVFVFVQLKDGTLRGWGEGYHGTLGNGSADGIFPGPQMPGVGRVLAHYISGRTSFVVMPDQSVQVWGPLRMKTLKGILDMSTVPVPFLNAE